MDLDKHSLVNKIQLLFRHGHSLPQRPRSFWSAPRIATSGQVQYRKSAIHGLPVILRMLRESSLTNLIGSGLNLLCLQSHSNPECRWICQRSRFLVLTKRSAASGDENATWLARTGTMRMPILIRNTADHYTRRIFISPLGVWKCYRKQSLVLFIASRISTTQDLN